MNSNFKSVIQNKGSIKKSSEGTDPSLPWQDQALTTSNHWADRTARKIIHEKGDKDCYVLAAGITPSGTVHIGNFREVIVVDLVARALQALGKKTRFIFSWDDFDPLRKIPSNFPEKTKENIPFASYLKHPLREIPDPEGNYNSFAERNEKLFEQSIKRLGLNPEFIYQHDNYTEGKYTEYLKQGLEKRSLIRQILNKYRRDPLPENWYPVVIFCHVCRKNDLKILDYDEATTFTYFCSACGKEERLDFAEKPCVKFLWRIDWPMRWSYEGVDFEPGGKDHSNDGGSFDTAKEIASQVFNGSVPVYLQYDFVLVKGAKTKMSSSAGNVMTVDELLEIYEPALVRYLYAAQRPNVDFSIALDKDVIKHYEAFDRLEREYNGEVGSLPPKKTMNVKRIYEFSAVPELEHGLSSNLIEKSDKYSIQNKSIEEFIEKSIKKLFRAPFRHLTNIVQIYDFAEEPILAYYADQLRTEIDRSHLRLRIQCAKNWLQLYSEEDFRFTIRKKPMKPILAATSSEFSKPFLKALSFIKQEIDNEATWNAFDEQTLHDFLYTVMRDYDIEHGYFFEKMYRILIDKTKGPRLSSFMLILGRNRLRELFSELPVFSELPEYPASKSSPASKQSPPEFEQVKVSDPEVYVPYKLSKFDGALKNETVKQKEQMTKASSRKSKEILEIT
ncbi:lysine--tRNA ligase [Spirochaetota bacterium]|nr:lysine--tRNA ligase [Spirochaetota bacterium]